MYDKVNNIVSALSLLIFVLGFIGFINSRGRKSSAPAQITDSMNPTNAGAAASGIPDKKPNILKQFAYSFIPNRYLQLATVKTGSMIGFVTLLSLLSTLCIIVMFLITFAVRGGTDAFFDWMPDFELKDGTLSLDEEYFQDTGATYVYLTDKIEGFREEDIRYVTEKNYRNVILGGRKKFTIIDNGQRVDGYYSQFGDDLELNRENVVEKLIPFFALGGGVAALFFFVGRTLWYFGCAALYLLAAMLITAVIGRKIPSGTLYRTAVYAKVPMFVLTTFWTSPSFSIIIRIAVTAVFMFFAIRNILNRQKLAKAEF